MTFHRQRIYKTSHSTQISLPVMIISFLIGSLILLMFSAVVNLPFLSIGTFLHRFFTFHQMAIAALKQKLFA